MNPEPEPDDRDGPGIGAAVSRREDPGLVTGRADFTNDLGGQRLAYVSFLLSSYPRAKITSIDTERAEQAGDVIGVYTASDLERAGLPGTYPVRNVPPDVEVHIPERPLVAGEEVRYQGEILAAVVAEDRYAAHDGVELIDVEYDRLEPVVRPESAEESEVTIHDAVADNVPMRWEIDTGGVERQLREADNVVELELVNQRLIPNPMEPRAVLADYDASSRSLAVQMSTQTPHHHRTFFAETLGLPEARIRVVAPSVGGGFGSKDHFNPAEVLVAWCAMQVGRPVKWQATRSEACLSDAHGRDHTTRATMAHDDDGTIRALKVRSVVNFGAYVSTSAPTVTTATYGKILNGQYDIPELSCRVKGVFTNTVPTGAYRGAGRPEATFVVERLVDLVARDLGMDPAAVRRSNFIQPDQFPYQSPLGLQYDSGSYDRLLSKALDVLDYEELRERQRTLRGEGRYLGIGISCFVETAGLGPVAMTGTGTFPPMFESSTVRVHPSGSVSVYCGTADQGQGHATVFTQIIAETLGVPPEEVSVFEGDTDQLPYGTGTFGSRSATVGGAAIEKAASRVIEKGRRIAAHEFEASKADVGFSRGTYSLRGASHRRLSVAEVARKAYAVGGLAEGIEPGLEATSTYVPDNLTFPFGAHVAAVEVSPDSGELELIRYVAADDCGVQINPTIVAGQIHGGVAQGIGQALYEHAEYDDAGNLISATLQDYTFPKAGQLREIETLSTITPSPHNPLGVKGVGEAGAIAAPPAIVNAIVDALAPFGVRHIDMPVTEEKIWRAMTHGSG